MKKYKALIITILLISMLTLICIGLFAMDIVVWKFFAIVFIIAGLYFLGEKFYKWISDECPLECVKMEEEAYEADEYDDLGGAPLA